MGDWMYNGFRPSIQKILVDVIDAGVTQQMSTNCLKVMTCILCGASALTVASLAQATGGKLVINGAITNMAQVRPYIRQDSRLALVRIPQENSVEFVTDKRGRSSFKTKVSSFPIPLDGRLSLGVMLGPGRYFLMAENLDRDGEVGSPDLTSVSSKKVAVVEVHNAGTPPLVDLGKLAFSPTQPSSPLLFHNTRGTRKID